MCIICDNIIIEKGKPQTVSRKYDYMNNRIRELNWGGYSAFIAKIIMNMITNNTILSVLSKIFFIIVTNHLLPSYRLDFCP
ncbi:MAG: hypothetical protein LUF26_01335, partial [Firmicutes bacterium]|nr:hypothetical protein [Bacillota bacterium]